MHDDLVQLLESVLRLFTKDAVIDGCKWGNDLIKIKNGQIEVGLETCIFT